MRYLTGDRAEIRRDSSSAEPGMRSALIVGLNYGATQPPGPGPVLEGDLARTRRGHSTASRRLPQRETP